MGSVAKLAVAGATMLVSTAALAADLPPAMPPPMPYVAAPVAVETGGWYLRGDIGLGHQSFKSFDFTQTNTGAGGVWPATWRIDVKDIKDTFFIGGGIGYQWNNWFRFDVTGEVRADVAFRAVGSYVNFPNPALGRAFDVYNADHSAVVFLANAYLDLGTWWCLTPFIGAGVGAAWHKITGLTDMGINNDGLGASAFGFTQVDRTQTNFAWAVHAGLAYNVNNNLKLEFAYRFLNMGNVPTAEVLCGAAGCGAGAGPRAFYTLQGFESHDFKIGMRWMLNPEPVAAPPVYAPPPLMRRG